MFLKKNFIFKMNFLLLLLSSFFQNKNEINLKKFWKHVLEKGNTQEIKILMNSEPNKKRITIKWKTQTLATTTVKFAMQYILKRARGREKVVCNRKWLHANSKLWFWVPQVKRGNRITKSAIYRLCMRKMGITKLAAIVGTV